MANPLQSRPKKRDLIRWDEDKDVILLLAIQFHCGKKGIKIPWDDVGLEIGPKVTGNAVLQHIAKLKKKREDESKPVPGGSVKRKKAKPAVKYDQNSEDSENSFTVGPKKKRQVKVKHESDAESEQSIPPRKNKGKIDSNRQLKRYTKKKQVQRESPESDDVKNGVKVLPNGERLLAVGQDFLKFGPIPSDTTDSESAEVGNSFSPHSQGTVSDVEPNLKQPSKVIILHANPQETRRQTFGTPEGVFQGPLINQYGSNNVHGSTWQHRMSLPGGAYSSAPQFGSSPEFSRYGFNQNHAISNHVGVPGSYSNNSAFAPVIPTDMRFGHHGGYITMPGYPRTGSMAPGNFGRNGNQLDTSNFTGLTLSQPTSLEPPYPFSSFSANSSFGSENNRQLMPGEDQRGIDELVPDEF